jgi:hypothetical protein
MQRSSLFKHLRIGALGLVVAGRDGQMALKSQFESTPTAASPNYSDAKFSLELCQELLRALHYGAHVVFVKHFETRTVIDGRYGCLPPPREIQ